MCKDAAYSCKTSPCTCRDAVYTHKNSACTCKDAAYACKTSPCRCKDAAYTCKTSTYINKNGPIVKIARNRNTLGRKFVGRGRFGPAVTLTIYSERKAYQKPHKTKDPCRACNNPC